MVLRERYIRIAASDHFREIAVHNPETTRKVRHLCRQHSVGCGLADQSFERREISGASRFLPTFANAIRAPVRAISVRL